MSPLKTDYFHSGGRRSNGKSNSKLFSPENNYLRPDASPSKRPALPSPVKFVSAETVESEDLSDLISSLARDQALELDLPVTDARVSVSSFLTSSSQEMPDVSDAVNNILIIMI